MAKRKKKKYMFIRYILGTHALTECLLLKAVGLSMSLMYPIMFDNEDTYVTIKFKFSVCIMLALKYDMGFIYFFRGWIVDAYSNVIYFWMVIYEYFNSQFSDESL